MPNDMTRIAVSLIDQRNTKLNPSIAEIIMQMNRNSANMSNDLTKILVPPINLKFTSQNPNIAKTQMEMNP